MKKILIILTLLLLTGCGTKKIVCTVNISEDYTYDATYTIYHDGKYVTKIVKSETYVTNDSDKFDYLKNYRELELESLKVTYGGYDYTMRAKRGEITIKTTIDAKKLDVEKMSNDKLINKYYVSKNKILKSGLVKHYESKSAICK